MPFDRIGVYDNSQFDHIPSGSTFILRRSHSGNRLRLKLRYENDDGTESPAGFVEATCNYDSFLVDGPIGSECHYTVRQILVFDRYRNISLGALLMFIIAREVQINGGVYLYLAYPVAEALGFYIQFGFHPAPEHVAKRHKMAQEERSGEGLDATIPFQDKFAMRRKYSLWRGYVSIALEFLLKKLNGIFTFHHPF